MAAMTKERLDEIVNGGWCGTGPDEVAFIPLGKFHELIAAARESIKLREVLKRISEYGCIEAEPYDGPCAASICQIACAALEAK